MTDTGQAAACPNDSSPAAHDKAAAGTPLFALGQLLATPGALELLETHELTALPFVLRHVSGDWGDICAEDRQANADALKLPLEMGVLSFVQNVDKELRNGGKASTCGIHAGI